MLPWYALQGLPNGGIQRFPNPKQGIEESDQQSKSGGFGSHRKESGNGCGGSFIDIGGPEVEGHRRNFVAEACHNEKSGDSQCQIRPVSKGRHLCLDFKQFGGTCKSKQKAETVKHDTRRKRTVNDIFQGGFT